MAILWQEKISDVNYEIREAGKTRRLYTDGVFHSQYNPDRALAGGVWDALFMPAFFAESGSIQRVLVLGVGGGAVIHLLQRYLQPDSITGIELNPVHIRLAKKYFAIKPSVATLHQADAVKWLQDYKGPGFDLIIEDLFAEQEGEPVRAVNANKAWLQTLTDNLSDNGMLVMNFTAASDLKNSAAIAYKKIARQFQDRFRISLPQYDNVIVAFFKKPSSVKICRENFHRITGLKNMPALSIKRIR